MTASLPTHGLLAPTGHWRKHSALIPHLTGIADPAGNSVTYALDGVGNRTAEQFKDPSGAPARSISRVFEALGRVQTVVEATH